MNTVSIRLALAAMAWCTIGCLTAAAADQPVRHSVYQFAPPDRYGTPPSTAGAPAPRPTSGGFAPPAANFSSSFAPPPDVVDNARNTFNDTSSALRRGVESGIQQANEQLTGNGNPFIEGARSVGQGLNSQIQGFAGSTGRQLELTGDNFRNAAEQTLRTAAGGRTGGAAGAAGFSEPPWPAAGSTTAPLWQSAGQPPASGSSFAPFAPVTSGNSPGANSFSNTAQREVSVLTTKTGWTTLGDDVPPPPLLAPSLAPPDGRGANVATPASTLPPASSAFDPLRFNSPPPGSAPPSGPQFPESSLGRGTIHSPLTDPGPPGMPAGRYDVDTLGAGNVRDMGGAFPPSAGASSGNDPFNLPPVQGGPSSPVGSGRPTGPADFAGQSRPGLTPAAPNNGAATANPFGTASTAAAFPGNTAPQAPATGANQNNGTIRTGAATTAQRPNSEPTQPTAAANQTPWVPLVLTALGLIGSLSANFFLGWSYMDARHKYQTLVRKTADKFRRAADAA